MAVFRVERNSGYTVMSNHHLRNKELTLKAKGLLSQMLSLPEDWDYTLAGLSHINRESIDAIRTAVWELEKAGYILRRQGRDEKGKMTAIEYTIYEQPQPMLENPIPGKPMLENPTTDNPTSENPTQLNKDRSRTNLPKKEKSITDLSNTDSFPILSPDPSPCRAAPERKGTEAFKQSAVDIYREIIMENIEYDTLTQNPKMDKERLDEIVDLMLETVCSARKTLRIAGDDYPAELVKSKFLKLNSSHIEFVMDCMRENTTKIRNIKQYLRAVLFNAPSTIDNYYTALVAHDNYSEDENPLALKSDFVLSLCELIMGGKTGLEAIERTVIDRAVQRIYQSYFADPRPENMPILSDLHAALTAQHLPEADRVAQALDLYVSGSLNFFNNRTTVDIDNRFVCFDIKELPKNLKKPGMLVIQDQVWNRVTRNRNTGVSTWYYADEFHLLLKEPQTAAYSAEIWKRFRKWGGVPTGATQNVKDLLSSPEIENILENSDFICMLNQAAGDRKILAERLNISPEQLKFVTNSPPGEGLLFFENVILPFADKFPRDTELYRIMSTKPSEVNGV